MVQNRSGNLVIERREDEVRAALSGSRYRRLFSRLAIASRGVALAVARRFCGVITSVKLGSLVRGSEIDNY